MDQEVLRAVAAGDHQLAVRLHQHGFGHVQSDGLRSEEADTAGSEGGIEVAGRGERGRRCSGDCRRRERPEREAANGEVCPGFPSCLGHARSVPRRRCPAVAQALQDSAFYSSRSS
jgi:hypothetical protein